MDDTPQGAMEPPTDLPEGVSTGSIINFPFAMVLADPRRPDCPIVYVNELFTEITGYTVEQSVGRNCRFLQGPGTRAEDRAAIRAAIDAGESLTIDIANYRADGTPFDNRLMLTPLTGDDGELRYFLGVQTDTSDNDTLTAEARELRERLRELQHRVKNHLAMILVMLRVESRDRPPEQVVELLTRRVEALAMLYELFSDAGDGSGGTLPLGAYLTRVAQGLQMLDGRPRLMLNTQMDEMHAGMDMAGRLGLFLSEVVTNAYRHGLKDREEGTIDVELTVEGATAELAIEDDGLGLGDAVWPGTTSVGSRIIADLVERLDGELTVTSGPALGRDGTRVALRFAVEAALEE
jgi:PAS domain S-box-containing protein